MFKRFGSVQLLACLSLLLLLVPDSFGYGLSPKGGYYVCYAGTTKVTGVSPLRCGDAAFAKARAVFLSGPPCVGGSTCALVTDSGCRMADESAVSCSAFYKVQDGEGNFMGNVSASWNGSPTPAADCRPNSTEQPDGQCVCNVGYQLLGQACSPYSCYTGQDFSGSPPVAIPNSSSSGACADGCVVSFDMKVKGADQRWYGYPSTTTGQACNGADKATGNDEKQTPNCPANQCPGTVNGATVCVPCQESKTDGPAASASSPDGSAAGPGALGDAAAPPTAVRSETSTSCTGGSCTTTTNYYNSVGGLVGSVSKQDGKGGFCQENPASPICKDSTIGGACASVTCSGDAIQCAIAREQAKRNCEFFGETAQSGIANDAAVGGLRPGDHPANFKTEISAAGLIDTSNPLGGGGGLADQSFDLAGWNITLPLSKANDPLQLLGRVFVALSMLSAAFIMFKS